MAELTGVVTSIIFRNEQNGYTVLEIACGREEFTAVGVMPFLSQGERVHLSGEWSDHPTFGPQLKVTAYDSAPPSTLLEIERYLASGIIRGVGPSTAKAIVEEFGEQTLDIMQVNPDRLSEVPGIGRKRAALISESFMEQRGMREVMIFLQRYEVTPAYVMKIYKKYEGASIDVIRDNPYRLVDDIQGIGFRTADSIAMRLGVAADSDFRICAGVKHVLYEAASGQGHVYLPRHELLRRAGDLLEAPDLLIDNAISALSMRREVVLRQEEGDGEGAIYLPSFFAAEGEVAMRLNLLRMRAEGIAVDPSAITDFEASRGIEFTQAQRAAVLLALQRGTAVITGGPGTGKTTIINCIITLIEQAGQKAALCAPTGRAAKRMSEATGREAKTLHRLLEYTPGGDEEYAFQKDESDPLEFDALIVDEMSMVDLFLMRSLMRAVRPGARLILVGDVDQLPSVGAGNVLRDIIDSGAIPVARLDEIFRQAQQSMIIRNAHAINRGEMPDLSAREGDFFFDRRDSMAAAAKTVVDLCLRRLPGFTGLAPRDIQVLCPMKKGEAGVHRLNQQLQMALNPPSPAKAERIFGETLLREGDKVMQTKNNYQASWTRESGALTEEGLGIFNGDIGTIEQIDAGEHTLTVRFEDDRRVVYEDANVSEIELAYAMSIHKSQGSEFPVVVVPIVSGPPQLLTRNLLYTAVTRARRLVVLVGTEDAISRMVLNNRIIRRYSMLSERIARLIEAVQ